MLTLLPRPRQVVSLLALALFWSALLAVGSASPASAEVKVRMGDDGVPFIYNESKTQRSRRRAVRLLPIPDSGLASAIERHAEEQGLPQRLVQALVQVESGYNPKARSHKGAQGLMQLMPATARELAVSNPYDTEENLSGGTRYLRQLLDRFGDVKLALAAYNAGPGAVDRHRGVPPYRETRSYVQRILAMVSGDSIEIDLPTGPAPKIYVVEGKNNQLLFTTTPP